MHRIAILWFVLLWTILPVGAQEKYEVRATWLTTLNGMDWPTQKATSREGVHRQQQELCRILDRLQAAHFNTVLFQTRLRGEVIYPSLQEGFAECLTGKVNKHPGYDPLQFAIEECHKRGMALHAWIVTIPVGSKKQVKRLGRNSVVAKHPSFCKQFRGSWYLDPGHPGTEDYLSSIVREIVSRYDVDGVHFDYIRYPEQGKRFPDYRSHQKYGKKKPLNQWRRENLTRIVRRLYTDVKTLKPWVVVSSSPIGKFNDTDRYRSFGWNAYAEVHQDAQGWMKAGIHDALFPMMYFKDNHFFPFALDWEENSHGRWIVPGLGIYFLDDKNKDWKLDDVTKQIHFTRQHHLSGQAYFRNKFLLSNHEGLWDELRSEVYTTPAVTPPLHWLDSIAPAAPKLLSFTEEADRISIRWEASATQKEGGILYRIYASNHYPVDTEKGANLVAVGIRDCHYIHRIEIPWQQKLYYAVTAVDRYGNESLATACNTAEEHALQVFDNELPIVPYSNTLVISDATGKELLRTKHPTDATLQRIGKGFYRLSLIGTDGSRKLIGTLIR